MTTIADRLTPEARSQLLARSRELRETARLMEERGTLASPPEPVPLHRAGRGGTPEEPQR